MWRIVLSQWDAPAPGEWDSCETPDAAAWCDPSAPPASPAADPSRGVFCTHSPRMRVTGLFVLGTSGRSCCDGAAGSGQPWAGALWLTVRSRRGGDTGVRCSQARAQSLWGSL